MVANRLVNPAPDGFDVIAALGRSGWGAIVLPPAWYPDDVAAELLVQFAEHIEEFVRHGYDVVCIGSCGALADPLRRLGVDLPESVKPASEDELSRFLLRRPSPTPGA